MPRYLSLSNGRLLVNFDRQGYLRDLYWPHVGQENHTEGDSFRFGVYCDGSGRLGVAAALREVP